MALQHGRRLHCPDNPVTESGSQHRIFYGWWMVGGAILSQFAFLSLSQAGVGVLLLPACRDLGWQTWQFTLGSSIAVSASLLSGTSIGRYVDVHGPRIPMLVGAIVASGCLYGLAVQKSLIAFWVLHLIAGLVGWNCFGPQVINPVLTKWFVRNRGWALAFGSIGISLTGMLTPIALTAIVDASGWRTGFISLSIFALAVIPVSLLMRRTPEDYGWLPDGGPPTAKSRSEHSLTRPEAVRTSTFWLCVLGFGLNTTALITILVHAIPFATNAGFSRESAAVAVAFTGLGNLSSKAVWGKTLTRIHPKKLVLLAYAISTTGVVAMLGAAESADHTLLSIGFLLYGFGFGGTIPLTESLWATYFGRAHIGAIRGLSYPISSIGSSVGPVLIGLWYDHSDSYVSAFSAMGVTYVGAALSIALTRSPIETAGP
ncbi:MAG: hypothetical protein CME19_04325 [Gemmatimonadetes bacterium]|nr:hypothetical protein [Gemmatimonadota bacterium]